MNKGFALILVLLMMSGALLVTSLALQQAVMSYAVAVAQYQAYQRQYANGEKDHPVQLT